MPAKFKTAQIVKNPDGSPRTMLSWVEAALAAERAGVMTVEEFTRIRNFGTEEELEDAIERMNAAGGYDNLA